MLEQFLWVEKYRPKTVEETILPADLKTTFQQFVDQKNIPNLILSGTAGVGKTTVARAMLEQLQCDYIIINGSMKGNIDTLRNDILNFASSVSFSGGRKYVILDEADYLNPNSTQPALRNAIEEFAGNCSFIFTCNFKNRIIDPLHSRCAVIDFQLKNNEKSQMAAQFFKRIQQVLQSENVEFDDKVIAELVKKHFPDFRRVINELQRYSQFGKIDSGILAQIVDVSINDIIKFIKEKDFGAIRKWVASNDVDATTFFRKLYDNLYDVLKPQSIPQAVIILADYQYKQAFVADQEINTVACLTELMVGCEFK